MVAARGLTGWRARGAGGEGCRSPRQDELRPGGLLLQWRSDVGWRAGAPGRPIATDNSNPKGLLTATDRSYSSSRAPCCYEKRSFSQWPGRPGASAKNPPAAGHALGAIFEHIVFHQLIARSHPFEGDWQTPGGIEVVRARNRRLDAAVSTRTDARGLALGLPKGGVLPGWCRTRRGWIGSCVPPYVVNGYRGIQGDRRPWNAQQVPSCMAA